MTNLWDEASRDLAQEQDDRMMATATIAVSKWWPFLAEAASERAFGHRLATVEDAIREALAQSQVTAYHQDKVLEQVAADFREVLATRAPEKQVHTEEHGGYTITVHTDEINGETKWSWTAKRPGQTFEGTASGKDDAIAKAKSKIDGAGGRAEASKREATTGGSRIKIITTPNDREAALTNRVASGRIRLARADLAVGDEVIWTDGSVPDFQNNTPVGAPGENGKPWVIERIETLGEFMGRVYPGGMDDDELDTLDRLAKAWIDRNAYTGLSRDTEALEVATVYRDAASKVIPLGGLVRSSVEAMPGQGEFPFA